MKTYLNHFLENRDIDFLKLHTINLWKRELPQTTPATADAADYIYELLKANGFETQRFDFVSDGHTTYQDKVMPLCWDVSYARLTVESEWEGDPVVADYEKNPFSIIRFSVSTPGGGICTRLVKWDQMISGADVKGAFVLLPAGVFPTQQVLVPILDAGAIGLVNGTSYGADYAPDCVHWANNCSETNCWYVVEGERDFVGFCVSPNTLRKLEKACESGEVRIKAETDSHRYQGTMPAVTALLPGESKREFWLMAHTAEPLIDDNSAGVIACVQMLIKIRDAVKKGAIPPLKYSIRVLFAPELYGMAAFANYFGGVLHERCIGALCVDGMPIACEHDVLQILFSSSGVPFYGNALMEGMWDEYRKTVKRPPFLTFLWDHFGDDCFMSERSVGLPTIMVEYDRKFFWHNSHQDEKYIDYERFGLVTTVYTAFVAAATAPDKATMERFLSDAAAYAIRRLAEFAGKQPPRQGTDAKERLHYLCEIEINTIKSFSDAEAEEEAIENCCAMIRAFADRLIPTEADKKCLETPIYDAAAYIIPERKCIGIPHDLANAPLDRRNYPYKTNIQGRIFSGMDGKKNLQRLIMEAEWEERRMWSEEELAEFMETLKLYEEFGYISLHKA